MTDRPGRSGAAHGVAAALAAMAVQQTPGVRTSHTGIAAAMAGRRAVISLDITTDARFSALEVAAQLQERLYAALHRAGVARASINVSILAIESPPPASLGPER